VRNTSILRALLGLKHTRITGFRFTETELVVGAEPAKRSSYCGSCGKRAPRYDRRERRWRHLDACGLSVQLEYAIWRVDCRHCGVTTEWVPWADGDTGFTRPFEKRQGAHDHATRLRLARRRESHRAHLPLLLGDPCDAAASRLSRRLSSSAPRAGIVEAARRAPAQRVAAKRRAFTSSSTARP
jgi:hypothetical protein